MNKIMKRLMSLALFVAICSVNGASQRGVYQGKEPKELLKYKK